MKEEAFSYANLANVAFLEELYEQYQRNPINVDPTWRYFFSGMEFSLQKSGKVGDLAVFLLIQAYREHGHKKASINPLALSVPYVRELDLSQYGLKKEDEEKSFTTFGLLPEPIAPLSHILHKLESVYCNSVGFEFIGLGGSLEAWMISSLEGQIGPRFSTEKRKEILQKLIEAECFETFIHTKYPGQVRFSLEGGEALIPMLKAVVLEGAALQVEDLLIGMSHRGRLNVLAHILNKSYEQIFHEFEDKPCEEEGSGDVKYHGGAHTSQEVHPGHVIEVALASNPSHLESVDPVIAGQVRAKQEQKKDQDRIKVIPLLIHGDASLSGQGVVYEMMQMGQLQGYTTGGIIHIIVNNQIGYTTLPKDSRSTLYCSDIAKTFGAPVFHVNGEDPEACVRATLLAMHIRQQFHVDVFLDLYCYRKYGHNEGDEPTFTQPLEYKEIKAKLSVREILEKKLLQEGVVTVEEIARQKQEVKQRLQQAYEGACSHREEAQAERQRQAKALQEVKVPKWTQKQLVDLAHRLCSIPEGFRIHPKLQRIIQDRLKLAPIDWGMGEHLAFASLLEEKIHVRLSGQDVGRGTFSHRHATWMDQETSEKYIPLCHLSQDQAPFAVYNSHLSEFAVMGFDFGYSLSYPKSLVLWEAQFGDFANGAQVIIDQYLATSEQKWSHCSNLTLLLPHGYEGKGPEHSSARLERFLQMCAEDNFIIANCTTPAQLYHLLRRQAYLKEKRPLIVFTPKALLRHPACTSPLEDFVQGSFQTVLNDPDQSEIDFLEKVIFCSGKIFYDLCQEREKRGTASIRIIRIEQLYPFPEQEIDRILQIYANCQEMVWVQEEPKNMGAWNYIQLQFQERNKLWQRLKSPLRYLGRDPTASPAAGSYAVHKKQYACFMEQVFLNGAE